MKFLSFSLLLPGVFAFPFHSGPHRRITGRNNAAAKAVYFLDDDPSGSSIVSLRVSKEATLSDPIRTSTQGIGAIGTNLTGFPNAIDALGSQSAVCVSGNLLFTVNAGSNTVAMFVIDPENPWHPRLIGEPTDTMGDFPMSVAYSEALKTVCVLNGGAKSGVSCFHVDPSQGLEAAGPLKSLGGAINETTPPSGPPGAASQIIFDPASKGVFAMIKGNAGSTPVQLGYIVGFCIDNGKVSSEPIFTQISGITMDFGSVFLTDTRLYLTDPSFGASILELHDDLKFTELVHTVVPNQKAICWSQYDPGLNTAYAIDAGRNKVFKMSADTGALEGAISAKTDGKPMDAGLLDSAVNLGDHTMYSLAHSNGIVVLDLETSKQLQYLDLSSFGNRVYYQGMAVYM